MSVKSVIARGLTPLLQSTGSVFGLDAATDAVNTRTEHEKPLKTVMRAAARATSQLITPSAYSIFAMRGEVKYREYQMMSLVAIDTLMLKNVIDAYSGTANINLLHMNPILTAIVGRSLLGFIASLIKNYSNLPPAK